MSHFTTLHCNRNHIFPFQGSFFVALPITIIQVEDKISGLVDRDNVAGVRFWHYHIATFFTQSLMIFIQIGALLGIMYYLYDIVINGSWVVVVALMYMTSFAGLYVGKNEQTVPGAMEKSDTIIASGLAWVV